MKYAYPIAVILAAIVLFICGIDGIKDLLAEHVLTPGERGVAVLKCSMGFALAGYLSGILACSATAN